MKKPAFLENVKPDSSFTSGVLDGDNVLGIAARIFDMLHSQKGFAVVKVRPEDPVYQGIFIHCDLQDFQPWLTMASQGLYISLSGFRGHDEFSLSIPVPLLNNDQGTTEISIESSKIIFVVKPNENLDRSFLSPWFHLHEGHMITTIQL